MARALITGLSGQDGSYLAELLLHKGYEVHGFVRESLGCAEHLHGSVVEHHGDLGDAASLAAATRAAAPDELYHLAGATHVRGSELDPGSVWDVVASGTELVLATAAALAPAARIFCASSSEIFGSPTRSPQDEVTPVNPRNPYGEAKVAALEACRAAREQGAWVSTGILYNHESPRRPLSFVTRKVTWHAAAIAKGRAEQLRIGNLDAQRDWGYAPEYVDGMWRALRVDQPDDFVFATGRLRSVRNLIDVAFARAGVPAAGHVVVDPQFVRAAESVPIVGNADKARRLLGWEAGKPFEDMIAEMVDHDMRILGT